MTQTVLKPGPDPDRLAGLALYLGLNLNSAVWHRVLGYAGSAAAAFEGFDLGLAGVNFPGLLSSGLLEEAAALMEETARKGLGLLIRGDPGYPARLAEIPDPPPVLWVKGALDEGDRFAVGLVGSRRASPAGLAAARELGRAGASRGLTIVSGLARGVDAEAHWGALEAGGRTLAVLGCGLDWVYPRENAPLYERIPQAGALISEFPPSFRPLPVNFPRRNRVLAGLSLAVVVVEAGPRSGALITARLGLELNREVMALPGPAGAEQTQGGNRLIKEGAALVENMDEVLAEIKPRLLEGLAENRAARPAEPPAGPIPPPLADAGPPAAGRTARPTPAPIRPAPGEPAPGTPEARVWSLLAEGPLDADTLGRAAGLSAAEMSLALLNLELAGLATKSPAGLFART
ncbi:MAG: DNA-processing protein DprA [Candidatus Adiutrix sp.]|jgi:DNA processing protein|nr:DNA-processing protein DprA [Candidatus Adiutrix sp.]